MRIAIQGHSTRGKEVIQILESLGGKNYARFKGITEDFWYFIGSNRHIIAEYQDTFIHSEFKTYTLEEFEKEFPFKIGDKVTFKNENYPYTIKSFDVLSNGDIIYEFKENGLHYSINKLEPYKEMKEMKEERNIKLTLDKAKEWYKKGGELKEIALQAFTEQELNPLPRSWEEYTDKMALIRVSIDKLPLSSLPKKYIALYKLERLRDCWRQGWEPNWLEGNIQKYVIQKWRDMISIEITYVTHSFLSFPTYETAKEFLECFKDLIEKAGDLI